MLTVPELQRAVEAVRYRTGWGMAVYEDEHEGPYLRILAPVENSYRPEDIDLGIDTYISPNDRESVTAFYRFLIWRLERIESHEAREMLRYRRTGKPVFDPHA